MLIDRMYWGNMGHDCWDQDMWKEEMAKHMGCGCLKFYYFLARGLDL